MLNIGKVFLTVKSYNVIYGPRIGKDAFVIAIPRNECDFQINSILHDEMGRVYKVVGMSADGRIEDGFASVMLTGSPDKAMTTLYLQEK